MRNPRCGLSLLELLVVIAIITALIGILLPAIQRVRAAASRASCTNNLHQIAMALHQYHDSQHAIPAATSTRDTKFPFIAWSARILPQLEQEAAWRDAEVDCRLQASFSGHRNLAREMAVFVCPADGRRKGTDPDGITAGFNHYLGNAGKLWPSWDGMLYPNSAVKFAGVTDGLSNTILVGERPPSADNSFGWWYAGAGQTLDGELDSHIVAYTWNRTFRAPTCPRNRPYTYSPGRADNMCDAFHFWSLHPGGANFAFADGSVRFLSYAADSVMPPLSTRAGGESVAIPD